VDVHFYAVPTGADEIKITIRNGISDAKKLMPSHLQPKINDGISKIVRSTSYKG